MSDTKNGGERGPVVGRTWPDVVASFPVVIIGLAVACFVALLGYSAFVSTKPIDLGFLGTFGPKESTPILTAFPPGAIVAFDGAQYEKKGGGEEHLSGCPEGWIRFRQAEGRFVLGVGPSTSGAVEYELRDDGGSEMHTLTVEQMPSHDHASEQYNQVISSDANQTLKYGDGGASQAGQPNLASSRPLALVGNGQPHNNMPPYIALYFCKKEAG